MNSELQEALTAFLVKSLDLVEKGANAAGEQIPLVLEEIVQWEIWGSGVGFVVALVIAICLAIVGRYCGKRAAIREEGWPMACSVLGAFVAFAISMGNLYCLIKALTAPRLVIIEFLKGML